MTDQPRTLVVIRHSRAAHSAATDFERPLTHGGARDAAEAGAWLAGRGVSPDRALVSAALRTRETWAALAEGAGWDVEGASYDEALYDAGADSALDLVRAVDPEVRTLVLVGHNPTMAYLAQLLDDGQGDEEASTEMTLGYPTSACTVLEVGGEWSDLVEASARVAGFHVGRS